MFDFFCGRVARAAWGSGTTARIDCEGWGENMLAGDLPGLEPSFAIHGATFLPPRDAPIVVAAGVVRIFDGARWRRYDRPHGSTWVLVEQP